MNPSLQADLRIVMAQQNYLVGDIPANARQILAACEQARDELGADAIVFPELSLTGYPPEDLLLRPHFIEQVELAVASLCRGISGITAIIGYPLRQQDKLYNVAGVIQEGEVTVYRKQHLPNYSVFDEQRYFTAGTEACVVRIREVPVGITVCEDIWEAGPAAQAKAAGAQLLINLNASPFHSGKHDERERLLARRAQQAGIPMMYVNLVGGQDELVFDGASFVVDRAGQVTTLAPTCESGLYPVDFHVADGVAPVAGDCAQRLQDVAAIYQVLVLGVFGILI